LVQCQELKEENKVIGDCNIASFYNFANRRLWRNDSVGALKDEHNIILTDNSDKAELLNKHCGSVCTVDDRKLPTLDYSLPNGNVIDSVTFNINTVQKSNTASGPDDLPPIMFKHLSGCLAEPLSLMFTSFMSVGEVPGDWRKAIITPIHKSRLASVASNYRLTALTLHAK